MSIDEERKLRIKIAQLDARLKVDLAWIFGLLAVSITLMIFGYQVSKENFSASVVSYIGALASFCISYGWMDRAEKCSKEFENLQ